MTSDIKYGGADDAVLKQVLHELWDFRCYWCWELKPYVDIELDHIIPRTINTVRLQQLIADRNLARNFDVDRPANLAPACGRCNREKSNQDFLEHGKVFGKLRRAEQLEPEVIRRVRDFAAANKVGKALMVAARADLTLPQTRRAFEMHGSAVVQQLAFLDEDLADFRSARPVDLDLDYRDLSVRFFANARGRAALTVIEEVCGCTLADAIEAGIDDLVARIHKAGQDTFEDTEVPDGPITSGPAESDHLTIDIDAIDFSRYGARLDFTFSGTFQGNLSAALVHSDPSGDGLDELQGDMDISGAFDMTATWSLKTRRRRLEHVDSVITGWDAEPLLWNLTAEKVGRPASRRF